LQPYINAGADFSFFTCTDYGLREQIVTTQLRNDSSNTFRLELPENFELPDDPSLLQKPRQVICSVADGIYGVRLDCGKVMITWGLPAISKNYESTESKAEDGRREVQATPAGGSPYNMKEN